MSVYSISGTDPSPPPAPGVAYVRAEGVLVPHGPLHAAAWLAAHSQELMSRFARFGAAALSAPLSFADPARSQTLAWSALAGTSEDRLVILGEEYVHGVLGKSLSPTGLALLRKASATHDVVLVTAHVETVARPLAHRLGIDTVLCNRLEIDGGQATGTLLPPVLSGHCAGAVRDHASRNGIDLAKSLAYGASSSDATLLAMVGRPCAVTPSMGLRTAARDNRWPVVEASDHAPMTEPS